MKTVIAKRILNLLAVLFGVSILCFLLLAFSGDDPAEIRARRMNINASEEAIASVRVEMGLDKPLPVRYINWIKGIFTGEMGISLYSARPIATDLSECFPITLKLVGMAVIWIVGLGLPVSLICARFKNSLADQVIRAVTILGICIPTFWLGYVLLLLFAVNLPIFTVTPAPGMKGLILPSFALALPTLCSLIRIFRSSLISQLSTDHVRYARARGLSSSRILINHVLRNALPPVVTMVFQFSAALIAGSAVVESVFSLKGIGTYIINCVLAADSTSVATCIVIIAAIFTLANLISEGINRLLCPWIRREEHD